MSQTQNRRSQDEEFFGNVKEYVGRHQKSMEILFGFARKEFTRDDKGRIIETEIVPVKKPS